MASNIGDIMTIVRCSNHKGGNMPDQEIIQEAIAKWLGFHKVPSNYSTQAFLWEAPNGGHSIDIPDFMESLDACFEWIVPRIWKEKFWMQLLGDGIIGWDCRIHHLNSNDNYSIYQHKELPMAICLATKELINKEAEIA